MASCRRAFLNIPRRTQPFLRPISAVSPVKLPRGIAIEEETLPHYEAEEYFPVHIGDIFNARYRVAGKLGYGAYSTS